MPESDPPIEAVDEVRQLNRLFLDFMRRLPFADAAALGLSPSASEILRGASDSEVERAAEFPRALFSIALPAGAPGAGQRSGAEAPAAGELVIRLVLLHSARNLCRMSGYWARLLLRLGDDEVDALRHADVERIVQIAQAEHVVRASFHEPDWIWRELLTESRPEFRRRLLLIGFQPDVSLQPVLGLV